MRKGERNYLFKLEKFFKTLLSLLKIQFE